MDSSVIESPARRGLPAQRNPRLNAPRESDLWPSAAGTWRLLHGSFYQLGVAIEAHDLQLATEFDWARSFHPDSLEICLNLSGYGRVTTGQTVLEFSAKTAGFYDAGRRGLKATRQAGQSQRFLTIEFSFRYLREHLSACDGALHPLVERIIRTAERPAGLGEVRSLNAEMEQLAAQLLHPPVAQAARPLWYHSKVLQLMVEFFFARPGADELFCDRQKRVARERADAVIATLRRHLAEPLGLEAIARQVGCSPFYLSRIFSQETGMSIPQYLRKLRMERAAELLHIGKHNVTEAAMEVGYSSLSHFSQAFCQTMGCCPALYPLRERTVSPPPQGTVKK